MVRISRTVSVLSDSAAIMVGLTCLVAPLAGQGGRLSARLDVLNHFAPLWLAGAVLSLGYGLVFAAPSLRFLAVGLGLAGVLAAAALIAPELMRPIRPNIG